VRERKGGGGGSAPRKSANQKQTKSVLERRTYLNMAFNTHAHTFKDTHPPTHSHARTHTNAHIVWLQDMQESRRTPLKDEGRSWQANGASGCRMSVVDVDVPVSHPLTEKIHSRNTANFL